MIPNYLVVSNRVYFPSFLTVLAHAPVAQAGRNYAKWIRKENFHLQKLEVIFLSLEIWSLIQVTMVLKQIWAQY